MIITYANKKDLAWLTRNDKYVSGEVLGKKITSREILIAKSGKSVVGWLRFGFFWDSIPFINRLHIEEKYRKQGIGKSMVEFFEKEMKRKKHKFVMLSSMASEEAQYFYRKLGYKDIGGLVILKEEGLELFFKKEL